MNSPLRKSAFLSTDQCFLRIEETLSKHRHWAEDVWEHRVGLSKALAASAHNPSQKKFRFGIPFYLAWLYWQIRKAAPKSRPIEIPPANFLIHITGNVSIEVDTLIPVACALRDSGHSVVVLLGTVGKEADEIAKRMAGIPVLPIFTSDWFGEWAPHFLRDAAECVWLMTKAFICLFPLEGSIEAFWNRGVWWLNNLLHFRAAERFWSKVLTSNALDGVAVASESAFSAGALCRFAKEHSVGAHHFLHGLPGLEETRGISSDVYCYSTADRDFFTENGWRGQGAHALGHPRQSALIQLAQQARALRPDQGGLRLLFASQPPSPGGFDAEEHKKTILSVLEAASALNLAPSEFRVRLHPVESIEEFQKIAISNRLPCPELGSIRRPIAEDLAWANVVITVYSTMSMEAAYADCLLIWLSFGPFRDPVRAKLVERGYGLMANTKEQLMALLAECRNPEQRSQLTKSFLETAKQIGVVNYEAPKAIAEQMVTPQRGD